MSFRADPEVQDLVAQLPARAKIATGGLDVSLTDLVKLALLALNEKYDRDGVPPAPRSAKKAGGP